MKRHPLQFARSIVSLFTASKTDAQGPDHFEMTATVEMTAAADGENKRPSFTIKAYSGVPMQLAASYYPVIVDLGGLKASRQKLPVLFNHDMARPVGQSTAIKIGAGGVEIAGVITGDDDDSLRIVSHAKAGFEWQASMGFSVNRREFLEAGKTTKVNGREVTGPLMIARESTLVEVSFVAVGADQSTSATLAARQGKDFDMDFQKWLTAKGITNFDSLSQPIKDQLKAAYDAQMAAAAAPTDKSPPESVPAPGSAAPGATHTASAPTPDVAAMVQKAVADALAAARSEWEAQETRRREIARLTASHPELQAKAIAEKWSVEKTELEVMRASRPSGAFNVNTGAGQGDVAPEQLLTAGLCLAGNLDKPEKHFDPKVLEAADRRYRGRTSLKKILLEAAWAGGYAGHHFDESAGGMRDILRAAFSTMSLPGILSNVANKFLLQGFTAVEDAWRQITAIRSVRDFKQVTSYRLTGGFDFEEVGADGELKHATTGEESFTNQARTFGIMHVITRKDIMNDDLGALTAIPQRIGRGGALKLNRVFWAEFMDNGSFFTADNANYQEGAATALGIDALTAAEQLFFDQVDSDGNPLAIMPELLLVPNSLNVTASKLFKDTELRDTTANKKDTTGNPHAGKFRVVRSAYLTNAAITGNSAKAWYLLANPSNLATIEVAFVNGVQQPTVETADADFNVLGVQMRGYWDFGVNKQDHRAGVKSKGEA